MTAIPQVFEKTPLEAAFDDGIEQFIKNYGCRPESMHISLSVKKALFRLLKKRMVKKNSTMQFVYDGLPVFDLQPPSPHFEVHLVKLVDSPNGGKDYWIQKARFEPKDNDSVIWKHNGIVRMEGYEYDSEEEAEWLTHESEIHPEHLTSESEEREESILEQLKDKETHMYPSEETKELIEQMKFGMKVCEKVK